MGREETNQGRDGKVKKHGVAGWFRMDSRLALVWFGLAAVDSLLRRWLGCLLAWRLSRSEASQLALQSELEANLQSS